MKKRILSLFLCLALFLTMLPTAVWAAEAETPTAQQTIRLLNGTITKGDLYKAFGGGASWPNSRDYHYSLVDQIAWKRVNQSDADSDAPAENLQDGKLYKLEKKTYLASEDLHSWKHIQYFQFQTYYKITVKEENLPEGGSVSVTGGTLKDGKYEVNKDDTLTLTFGQVEDQQVQVQTGTGAWVTVSGNTWTHTAIRSTTLSVRYVDKPAEDQHHLTVSVNDPLLGEYSGIESDYVDDGTIINLTVTPYNTSTGQGTDRWAYVKSVKVGDTELTGTYENTVFTGTFTVTGNTNITIEFAPRLVLKDPAEGPHLKWDGDTEILMYSAKMNMDKKVSEQVPAIEQSILDSTLDKTSTPGAENVQIELKGELNDNPVYHQMNDMVKPMIKQYHWGDYTFHNDDDKWEEIRLVLPASEDGRYPAVTTDDLTVWVLEARTTLKIEGTAANTTVETEANIAASIEAAVLAKILADNPGATPEKIGAGNISYSYDAPKFSNLSVADKTDVAVSVTVKKGDHYLDSTGNVTVPVYKASEEAKVSATAKGGTASYTRSGDVYTFTLTPEEGYYLETLTLRKDDGTPETLTATPAKDGKYSYTYTLTAENDHTYTLHAVFVQYSINTSDSANLSYYDGMYTDTAALIAAVKAAAPATQSPSTFAAGTMTVQYLAGTGTWLTIGADLPDNEKVTCHSFGEKAEEKIRYCYTVTADGFTVTSKEITLTLTDGRIPTEIKLKATSFTANYSAYAAANNKTGWLLENLLDGVYTTGDDAAKIGNATVAIANADLLEAKTTEITLSYAGDSIYQAASAKVELTLNPAAATVTVQVSPTTVVYGNSYQVNVTTTPANLQTIQFVLGLDLTQMQVRKSLYPVSLSILGPEGFRSKLQAYAQQVDTDGNITIIDLFAGLTLLAEDAEALHELNVPSDSLTDLATMLQLASVFSDAPVVLDGTLPQSTGFYLVGAITAQNGYAVQMAVDYLTITPRNIKATLAWTNDIGTSVSTEQLTGDYLNAKVASVESGTVTDAEQQLVWLFLGMDEDGKLTLCDQSELAKGSAYTQVAFLKEWTGNVQYASVPILREFAVGAEYANVQFVDADGEPTDLYLYDADDEISAPVTVNGETVTEGLTIRATSINDIIGGTTTDDTTGLPKDSGLYLLSALYQKKEGSKIVATGKDSAMMVISAEIEGLVPRDTTVSYDGQEHMIDISYPVQDLYVLSVVIDQARKTLNVLLPESSGDLIEELGKVPTIGELLALLQTYSATDAQAQALNALLAQVQKDIQDFTGWTVSVAGPKPKDVGTYTFYLLTYCESGLYMTSRTLTITPKAVTITGLGAENKEYDGTTAATITGTAKIDGIVTGDNLTIVPGTAAFASSDAGNGLTVTFSGYTLSGNDAGNYALSAQPADVTANITPKTVTLTGGIQATDRAYDGTVNVALTRETVAFTGLVGNETLNINIPATGTVESAAPGNGKTVTYSGVTLADGSGKASNYQLSGDLPTVTVNITQATLTCTGTGTASGTYGDKLRELTVSGLTVTFGDTSVPGSWSLSGDTVPNVGDTGTYTATFTPSENADYYQPLTASVTLNISKAEQAAPAAPTGSYTVNAAGTAFVYTVTAPTGSNLEYSKDGYIWQSSPDFDGFAAGHTVTFYARVAEDQNHVPSPASSGTEVTFAKLTQSAPALYYQVSGNSGDRTITITSVDGAQYSFDGGTTWGDSNTKTNINNETVSIAIRMKETAVYLASNPAMATVNTAKAAQTVTLDTTDRTAVYGDGTLESRTATAEGSITYSSSAPKVATVDEATGAVTVLAVGETVITASAAETENYDAAQASYKLTVTPRGLTITVADKSAYVGDAAPDLTSAEAGTDYTLNGLVTGDTLTVTLKWVTEPDMSKTGEYEITAEAADDNYTISVENGKLTVSRRPSSGNTTATAYPITVAETHHGTASADRNYASRGVTVTVTVMPDAGYTLASLRAVDNSGRALELTALGGGKYTFRMPASAVTVTAMFCPARTFVDIPANSYYADAVRWAVENGITDGVDQNHFAPDSTCTRAQAVTFLWRAAGCPQPSAAAMPFADVVPGSYYETAVLWAVENGITNGVSATAFDPDASCTRVQIIAFLFRFAAVQGMEAVTMQELVSGYTDAAAVPGYALPAMNWALSAGIIQGADHALMPNAPCTRAQIVTFLYRAMQP